MAKSSPKTKRAAKSAKRETPHGRLKKSLRDALRDFSSGRGVLVPVHNLRAKIPDGRSYTTGSKGAADDLWMYRPEGWRVGLCVAVAYKAGADEKRPSQETFETKWNRAGGFYTVARDAKTLLATVKTLIRGLECEGANLAMFGRPFG